MASNTTPPTGPIAQQPQNQQNGQTSATPQQPPASPPKKSTRRGSFGKTLRDWLNLFGVFLIPFMIGVFTIVSSVQQSNISQQQHNTDMQIALDQQHATTLQTYMDNIQDLLLKNNLLGDSPPPKNDADKVTIKEVQELARARTLTALQGLDPHRKGVLLKFLFEADLIGYFDSSTKKIRPPIINLTSADLTHTDLTSADLTHTGLNGADLTGALLDGAYLNGAYLDSAYLDGATLTHTNLTDAYLTAHTDLTGANLSYANLTGANLDDANLTGANLTGADLNGTTLDGANLQGTNVTQQQLNQVIGCKRAILPAGLTCHHNQ